MCEWKSTGGKQESDIFFYFFGFVVFRVAKKPGNLEKPGT